ncbi:hypothetical protein DFH07DRAFT_848504 [Mycena maculata]|uniref:Uncharacterized protein n=1 Tax=Mycena maculata TaxID=230809 RepID=A0AAD7MS35_9AGAR|nr:hypothetical protein DFH07DRAFT_848504 [Mycena maculata]
MPHFNPRCIYKTSGLPPLSSTCLNLCFNRHRRSSKRLKCSLNNYHGEVGPRLAANRLNPWTAEIMKISSNSAPISDSYAHSVRDARTNSTSPTPRLLPKKPQQRPPYIKVLAGVPPNSTLLDSRFHSATDLSLRGVWNAGGKKSLTYLSLPTTSWRTNSNFVWIDQGSKKKIVGSQRNCYVPQLDGLREQIPLCACCLRGVTHRTVFCFSSNHRRATLERRSHRRRRDLSKS